MKRGIYFHIPFCNEKCPYCDFYSLSADEDLKETYVTAVSKQIQAYAGKNLQIDTVYFGGGTPSLMESRQLLRLINSAKAVFDIAPNAEITLEANPADVSEKWFAELRAGGFNRVSIGMQSANEAELRLLGRRHSGADVEKAVYAAKSAGIENISLDLMLALPNMTEKTLQTSIDFAASLPIQHVSAYLLKVEKGTPFYDIREQLYTEEDTEAAQYLYAVKALEEEGFCQYEISNFAKPGYEGRHNLHYWRCEEYLGFGPGAHSFFRGKRFYYPRDIREFITGNEPMQDGNGGGFEEYAMLSLRLREGITREQAIRRFPEESMDKFEEMLENVKRCPAKYVEADEDRICLTSEGFAVSNAVILRLLGEG